MVIRNTIRRLRFDRAEMTQQELADQVGVTRQTINAIELGKYSPSLEVAFRIAAVFGVPLEQVFQYNGVASTSGAHDQPNDRSRS
jgi:putative transcriptional regulator